MQINEHLFYLVNVFLISIIVFAKFYHLELLISIYQFNNIWTRIEGSLSISNNY